MTTRKNTCECGACRRIIGLWQAAFTSECAHTFHLRCVSGAAECPVCAARSPAPSPASPFAFASTTTNSSSASSRTPLFGQPSPSIVHNSSFTVDYSQPLFGQPSPWPSTASQDSSLSLSGAHPPVVVAVPATGMDGEYSCVEVARERFRVEAAEDIAAARAAAGRGDHARAAQILERRQEAASAAAGRAVAGDDKCAELVAELRELSARVAADRRLEYEQTGMMSSHAQQRAASTVPPFGTPAGSTFGATARGLYLLTYGLMVPAGAQPTPAFGSR